jgi:hypothetical protein
MSVQCFIDVDGERKKENGSAEKAGRREFYGACLQKKKPMSSAELINRKLWAREHDDDSTSQKIRCILNQS